MKYTRRFAWVTVGSYCTATGGEEVMGPSAIVRQHKKGKS